MTKPIPQTTLLVALFLAILVFSGDASAQDKETRTAMQVSGSVVFGPFEFRPPQGYWYSSGRFPHDATLEKDQVLVVTFRETKDEIDLDNPSPSFKVIFNIVIGLNNYFKDLAGYRDDVEQQTDPARHVKELPEPMNALFKNIPEWYCRENVLNGYLPLVSFDCARVGEYIVLMSAIAFDEKKVIDKAPVLADMIRSLKVVGKK
jgi:hypothetical protein